MSGKGRLPGTWLWRAACRLCTRRFRETVVGPTLADLQHEYCEAEGRRRRWIFWRGVFSLAGASFAYAVRLPGRHLREVWLGFEAPGWQMLRGAIPIAFLAGSLIAAAFVVRFRLNLPPWVDDALFWELSRLSALNLFLAVFPVALALGLARSARQGASGQHDRAALGIATVVSLGLLHVYFDVLPVANRVYRDRYFAELIDRGALPYGVQIPRGTQVASGPGEMTFSQLGKARLGIDGPYERSVRSAQHARVTLPFAVVSLVALGLGLSRAARPGLASAGVFAIGFLGFHGVFRLLSVPVHDGGRTPFAGWIAHAVVLAVAAVAWRAGRAGRAGRDGGPRREHA